MCVNLNYFLMNILLSVIAFIILLAILVGFHEWGHLSVARANGVFCEIFSFGMGPKIFERTDKYGTKWRISLFPIGGYVKMFGDADATGQFSFTYVFLPNSLRSFKRNISTFLFICLFILNGL